MYAELCKTVIDAERVGGGGGFYSNGSNDTVAAIDYPYGLKKLKTIVILHPEDL